ncbi:hypothetical protein [Tessaracoccus sp.]
MEPDLWPQILRAWWLVEDDFHEVYGVKDLQKELHRRSWYWLQARLYGLLLLPPSVAVGYGVSVVTQRTRLGHHLYPERVTSSTTS